MKLSDQAIGALLMTLQKCLAEETDITELLKNWRLSEDNGEINVVNPPSFKSPSASNTPQRQVFETE
tara:strand:+ start:199 stop:399 length:201 start_codon:yes stop_codon:yes gene_type:complete